MRFQADRIRKELKHICRNFKSVRVEDIPALAHTHFFDNDGDSVGNLLVAEPKDFFPYHFAREHALGLVGQGVVLKEVTALHSLSHKLVLEVGKSAAVLSGNGNDRREVRKRAVVEDLLHKLFLFPERVDFVNRENCGDFHLLYLFDKALLGLARVSASLDDEHCAVNSAYALADGANHILAEVVLGLVHTRGIDENKLCVALGEHASNAVSGGLGLARDYRHLGAEKPVEKRAFADVGSADDCDKRGFLFV